MTVPMTACVLSIVFALHAAENMVSFYSSMDRLSSILPKVLRKRGLQEHAVGALVVLRASAWIAMRLPELAGMVRVRSFKEGTLHIVCTHSVAVQECQGLIANLHHYLRSECDVSGIIDIRIARN